MPIVVVTQGLVKKRGDMNKSIDTKSKRCSPHHEADSGPLAVSQIRQIKKLASQGNKHSVRSGLFESHIAFR